MNSSIDTTSTARVFRIRKVHALAVLLVVSLLAPAFSFSKSSDSAPINRADTSSFGMRLKGGGFGYSRQLLPGTVEVFANLKGSASQDKSNNSVGVEVDESSRFIRHKADLSIQSKLPSLLVSHLTGACGTLDNTRAYKGLVFKCIADTNKIQSRKNSWALISVNKLTKVKTVLLSCQDPGKKGYVATKTVKGVTYTCVKISGVYVWMTNSQASLISLPSRGSAPAVSTIPSSTPVAVVTPTTSAPTGGGGDGGGGVSLLSQSITFNKFPVTSTYGDALLEVAATSDSGLPVSLSVSYESERICSIKPSGNVETLSSGVCTIVGSQSGNAGYASASETRKSFTINKASQTVTFDNPGDVSWSNDLMPLVATSSSGLPVSFSSDTELVCSVANGSVQMVKAGDCTISASQVGSDQYASAQANQQTFAILRIIGADFIVCGIWGGAKHCPDPTQPNNLQVATKWGTDVELVLEGGYQGADLASATFSLVNSDAGRCLLVGNVLSALHKGVCEVTAELSATPIFEVGRASFGVDFVKRSLAVIAEPKSKKYCEADPALTYTVGGDGLVGTDTLSGELGHTSTGHAGNWKITKGSLAASADYEITAFTEADFEVKPCKITVIAEPKSKKYCEADPALTYTVGGDGLVGTDTLSGELGHTSTGHAGNWKVTKGSLAASADYEITAFTEADFEVKPCKITVIAEPKSKKYCEADPALTYTVGGDGLVGTDTLSGELGHTSTGHAGNWKITKGSLAASADYEITAFTEADFEVKPCKITVIAEPKSKKYCEADPALTYTVGGDGLVGTDTLSGELGHTSTGHAGNWKVTKGSLAASADYEITAFTEADFEVKPCKITVIAEPKSKKYCEADPALTYTVGGDGLVGTDTLSGELGHTSTGHAGNWKVTKGSLAASADYEITGFVEADFEVKPCKITVSAHAKSKKYGEADPELTYTVGGDGLVNGDALSGALGHTSTGHAGNWKVTKGSLAASSDYEITAFNEADFVVSKRDLVISANAKSKKYGEADPELTYTVGGDGLVGTDSVDVKFVVTSNGHVGKWKVQISDVQVSPDYVISDLSFADYVVIQRQITVSADAKSKKYGEADPALTYLVGGDGLVGTDTLSGLLDHTSTGHAGNWKVTKGSLAASADYEITAFNEADFVVNKRDLVITANAKSKKYGEANPELTYLVGGDGLVGTDTLSGLLDHTSTGHAGNWKVTKGSLAASADYEITSFVEGDFVVSKRQITVSADAKSKKYGEANPELTYLVGGDGLVGTDTLSGELGHTSTGHAGNWKVTKGSLASSDYEITAFNEADFVVSKRQITVSADAKSKKYGEANPALTYTVGGDGLVGTDTLSGLLDHTSTGHAGNWKVTKGSLAASSDYEITAFNEADFVVNKRDLVISANAKSKKYGEADPELTYTVGGDGLVGTDTLSGELGHTSTGHAGNWKVTKGSLAASADYEITSFVEGDFVVNPRTVSINPVQAKKKVKESDPALSYVISGDGLISGDSVLGSITRAAGEAVGKYRINTTGLVVRNGAQTTQSADYVVTETPVDFEILKRNITITATGMTKQYGAADPVLTYTVTGDPLVSGDSLTGFLTYTGSNVGTYAIGIGSLGIAPAGNAANYEVTFVSASMTITQKTRTGTLSVITSELKTVGASSTATSSTNGDGSAIWTATGICSVSSGGVVTINSSGSCTVTVTYNATTNYTSWTTSTTFTVKP